MKQTYACLLLVCIAHALAAQSIFDNPITGTNPNTANPYTTGQTVDPKITVSGIGRGAGATGSNANNRYNANSWNTAVLDPTAYFEFTLTPNSGAVINFVSFVYTGQSSSTNISDFAFRSSIDGFTADIGVPTATGTTIDLSAPAYQSVAAAITFRLYAWGAAATASNTFSINDFTFNGVTGTLLPVTLTYFNASREGSKHNLNWQANCSNTSGAVFNIERSNDGRNFKSINSISATYTRCLQPFEYIDNNPLPGKNYYRLTITEDNGNSIYSNIIALLNGGPDFYFTGLQPSLVQTTAVLNITGSQKMPIQFVITDISGRQVQRYADNLVAGNNQLTLHCSSLAPGVYQVVGYTAAGQTATLRFIKQ